MRIQLKHLFFIGGLLILALGINMMTTVTSFGLSPYDSLFIALFQNFGVSIGFWMFMINFVFTIVVWVMDKSYLTIGTILTMILISVFVDAIGSVQVLMDMIRSFPKLLTLVLGNICIGTGIGIYVASRVSTAPQEAFVLVVSDRTKWTFRKTEIMLAFIFLAVSFSLDGPIYFGTIVLSFTTGWIIQAALNVGERVLQKAQKQPQSA
ncbi:YczE/YyaS/YitT family protein [Paenibacillus sp. 481]|uniref:YczE/YyaS/YitT family protein n=1 Tax=Paenibacillus sp. 481 TaxID=2835869 RepID=UPI001E453290|nr:YitT family protein [Paenibacillus sp. 481]UHA75579.1 YitT family protein [Paenibacillus sp. 481]